MLGKKFGMLTITSEIYTIRTSKTYKVVDAVCDCGKKVIARHVRDILKYKNPSCGCINMKKRPDKICPICGKTFNKPANPRCCSRTCMGKWYKQNGIVRRDASEITCWLCGKEVKSGRVACRDHSFIRLKRATSCPTCGVLVYLTRKHKSRYCSEECKAKATAGCEIRPTISGWANAIINRANATCQVCGTKDATLHAHHMKSMRDCATREEAEDLGNGIAMCAGCHRTFHSFYGMFKNTPEEVAVFIADFQLHGRHVRPLNRTPKRKPRGKPAWASWYSGKTMWTTPGEPPQMNQVESVS